LAYKQPSSEEVRVQSPTQQDTLTRGIKVRVSADVRVWEPGSNSSDGITCVFVRKVINLAFEKNLMRSSAVDFKNSSVGVVDYIKPELVPVLMVMNHAKGAMPGAGASMTAAVEA
jgi:hypothetical protein